MINNNIECKESKIWELVAEIDRLNKENEKLKVENVQLRIEKDEWKFNCELLHNMLQKENQTKEFLNNDNEGGYTNEQFDNIEQAYAEYGYTC
jgi:regulator of replication initiation timing